MTYTQGDAQLVAAAREGVQEALDELVSQYLPLVYNIVGRALLGRADVDDVVQETMLRVVRGLSGLRDEQAFRSWLVAVTMNQIRTYRQSRSTPLHDLDELAAVADPGADFADLTLTELGLSGQRRETVEATRWLDEDDRELLSLWWLVTTGHLTRAELVDAAGLDSHHVTVRVSRMKAQLETARMVVRALAADPRCPELAQTIHMWDGRPSTLWRKRLARHLRECVHCGSLGADLVPAERLLVNLALVPLPLGITALVLARTAGQAAAPAGYAMSAPSTHDRPVPRRRIHAPKHRARRSLAEFTGKPLLTAAAVTATVTAAVGIGVLASGPGSGHSTVGQERLDETGETSGTPTPSATATPSAETTPPKPSPSKTPRHTASPSPTHTASSSPHTTAAHPLTASPSAASPEAAAAAQVLAVINQARAAQNLAPLQPLTGLESSAGAHNQTMAAGCGLQHQCPGEAAFGDREHAAGVSWGAAGENIGTGGPIAHTTAALTDMAVGITKSMLAEQPPNDGHRRNILNPGFRHIGIQILHDKSGTLWMTQDFSD
ncbi:hypothetical protein AAW14_01205 [Streptomyces hygroscopicus]|uniref:sigma-70 family RNA polymerase sigma factor n=1 Tax=Streptomyces hygroscopicus TaxID=1912 RepID=UPI0022401624|nr:sigma-70 family RNA polymerase sigma factor [Streptomyces hygroscopicus]MCW7940682.1 hypothetical protein [Streptomyces hygroscopicus]